MERMSVHLSPEEIERESFRIIEAEASPHDWDPLQWQVVRRMIHTSADFSYADDVAMIGDPLARGIDAIRRGRSVVTDTTMALAGISKPRLELFGITASCLVGDPLIARSARKLGMTRSILAIRSAAQVRENGIFVIGNAPTALFELCRLIDAEGFRPDLVVGLPVGFVGAAESKEELIRTAERCQIPCITNRGRRGGSNVAAAVMNALLIIAAGETEVPLSCQTSG